MSTPIEQLKQIVSEYDAMKERIEQLEAALAVAESWLTTLVTREGGAVTRTPLECTSSKLPKGSALFYGATNLSIEKYAHNRH
jgi:hypothetical protein